MKNAYEFIPDSSELWTVDESGELWFGEKKIKFQGPGWYFGEKNTVLILESPSNHNGKQLYCVHYYNGRNPWRAFQEIVHGPVCIDEKTLY